MSISDIASLYGHAFGAVHVCPNNGDVPISGVSKSGSTVHWVGVAKLSGVFYCECTVGGKLLSVIRSSGVSDIQGFLMC